MPPLALPAPYPPDPSRLQQARADRAEREAKERKKKRQPCRTRKPWFAPTGLYSWYCIGTAFCGYAITEVETGMQACSQQECAGAQRAHTHAHTHTHRHALTHTYAHTHRPQPSGPTAASLYTTPASAPPPSSFPPLSSPSMHSQPLQSPPPPTSPATPNFAPSIAPTPSLSPAPQQQQYHAAEMAAPMPLINAPRSIELIQEEMRLSTNATQQSLAMLLMQLQNERSTYGV